MIRIIQEYSERLSGVFYSENAEFWNQLGLNLNLVVETHKTLANLFLLVRWSATRNRYWFLRARDNCRFTNRNSTSPRGGNKFGKLFFSILEIWKKHLSNIVRWWPESSRSTLRGFLMSFCQIAELWAQMTVHLNLKLRIELHVMLYFLFLFVCCVGVQKTRKRKSAATLTGWVKNCRRRHRLVEKKCHSILWFSNEPECMRFSTWAVDRQYMRARPFWLSLEMTDQKIYEPAWQKHGWRSTAGVQFLLRPRTD